MVSLIGLRIALATSGHTPSDDRIFFKEARTLARAGADVTVISPRDRHPPRETYGVKFQNYDGGGRLSIRAVSINVLARALVDGDFHVIHCHEPDSLLAALRAKRRTRVKVIFDSHEMWSCVAAGRFPALFWKPVEKAFRVFERRWISQCDAAIGASWAISEYLAKILPPDRVITILNVPVVEVFGTSETKSWEEPMILCHDGHLTFGRGLKTMAKAVDMVLSRHPIIFKIVGDVYGKEKTWLDQFVGAGNLQNIIIKTGWLPYQEVGNALAPCHIGLIALQKTPNNVVTSSNKVFNYMLYGIPFIGPDFRLAKQKLVAEEQCGILADSASPKSYASAICQLIENRPHTLELARNAADASRNRYRWHHMEPLLLSLYGDLVAETK